MHSGMKGGGVFRHPSIRALPESDRPSLEPGHAPGEAEFVQTVRIKFDDRFAARPGGNGSFRASARHLRGILDWLVGIPLRPRFSRTRDPQAHATVADAHFAARANAWATTVDPDGHAAPTVVANVARLTAPGPTYPHTIAVLQHFTRPADGATRGSMNDGLTASPNPLEAGWTLCATTLPNAHALPALAHLARRALNVPGHTNPASANPPLGTTGRRIEDAHTPVSDAHLSSGALSAALVARCHTAVANENFTAHADWLR